MGEHRVKLECVSSLGRRQLDVPASRLSSRESTEVTSSVGSPHTHTHTCRAGRNCLPGEPPAHTLHRCKLVSPDIWQSVLHCLPDQRQRLLPLSRRQRIQLVGHNQQQAALRHHICTGWGSGSCW